ncbi:MAG: phenylalanine--tRNA ligase subunit beta, partial [Pseudomonadota bacterium]
GRPRSRAWSARATGVTGANSLTEPDTVIDLDLTPNRGDCFSVLGIAREVAAFTQTQIQSPDLTAPAPELDEVYSVQVENSAACPRFASQLVRGINPNAVTPVWMTERLRRCGLRAIHPVVDITNYVMLELGQPLHAYDVDKLTGPIVVRNAAQDEPCVLLDERELKLDADVIAVTDSSGVIGMAGIMGGLSTSVTDDTCNVLFEGAFWSPDSIAGRARRYGMHTDASLRFERGVDPQQQARAVARAGQLLVSIAGGQLGPLSEVVTDEQLPSIPEIALPWAHLERVLGIALEQDAVIAMLESLGMQVAREKDGLRVVAPSHRFDMAIAEDLIEEVARIYGYDQIPEVTAIYQTPLRGETETLKAPNSLRAALVNRGYAEILTYSFVEPGLQQLLCGEGQELTLSNPISNDLSVMRRSLLPGLIGALRSNKARQRTRIRLFEMGNCFAPGDTENSTHEFGQIGGVAIGSLNTEQWAEKPRSIDFFDIKSDVEALFGPRAQALSWKAGAEHPALHPGQSAAIYLDDEQAGWAGALHPRVLKDADIDSRVFAFEIDLRIALQSQIHKAKTLSKFPAVRRDIAVLVDQQLPVTELLECVKGAVPELLRELNVFDIYQVKGIEPGRKSVALGLILQETSRTLTDEETDRALRQATDALAENFGAKLRDR